ncbi:MAG: hypothetical protein A2798_02720 [Candidatus Levybacteria bacterium RIFCSPHIGHO2_01_FULL_37_17]|nr:MAG: hypothetical protein A2798_02720 [Candidatus Levybacteria bacterium RIFCSPHIGHO2_01_FULL_37_17]OGH36769.1 MAG: hypothetical protein A2959_00710 [Candidatus Levybacteria bacterium RIFCSPLOWO2_01_FULL_38_23]
MEKHEGLHKNKKEIFINNFIGGISWGLGATVGLAVVLTTLGIIIKNVNLVPFVGSFVADVIKFVLSKNPELLR